jgi:hypothetical protein
MSTSILLVKRSHPAVSLSWYITHSTRPPFSWTASASSSKVSNSTSISFTPVSLSRASLEGNVSRDRCVTQVLVVGIVVGLVLVIRGAPKERPIRPRGPNATCSNGMLIRAASVDASV